MDGFGGNKRDFEESELSREVSSPERRCSSVELEDSGIWRESKAVDNRLVAASEFERLSSDSHKVLALVSELLALAA
jgi:hypothetical protein